MILWMSEQDIVNFIAVSESTPGSFAVNVATYVGEEVAGIAGSVCATLGVVLPSFIIILIIAERYITVISAQSHYQPLTAYR